MSMGESFSISSALRTPAVTHKPQPKPRTSNFKHMLRKHGHGCSGHGCAPGTVPPAANCRRSPSCAGCRTSWPVIGPFMPSPSPPHGGPAGRTKVDVLHGPTRTSLLPLRVVAVGVSRCSDPPAAGQYASRDGAISAAAACPRAAVLHTESHAGPSARRHLAPVVPVRVPCDLST